MSEITKTMDSVFDDSAAFENEFDTIFDEDDSLIDTVAGVNEAGEPVTGSEDFEVLHQTQDEATPKDIEDELGENHDNLQGAKDPEGSKEAEVIDVSVKGEEGKESDDDKFTKDAEEEYQDAKDSSKGVDENDIEKTIDNAVDESMDIDALLSESETGADEDVQKMVDEDPVDEQKDIDEVLSADSEDENLDYDISDEDLIDMAINGKSL